MRDTGEFPPGQEADTAVLAQRIARLARSARTAFVPTIARLHASLQDQLRGADAAPLLRAIQDMHLAVADAQCQRGRPRWLQWLGLARNVEKKYQADCREAMRTRAPVASRAEHLAQAHRPEGAGAGQLLAQLLATADDMDASVLEAQEILATLWEGLRPQRPDPADPGSLDNLRALLAGVDEQRALIQRLDAACGSARDVVRLGRAVLAGRDTVQAVLDARFERGWDEWRRRVEPLLRDDVSPQQVREGAREATAPRRALQQLLEQARGACTRLQIDEQALAHAFAQLGEQLALLHQAGSGDEWATTRGDPLEDARP